MSKDKQSIGHRTVVGFMQGPCQGESGTGEKEELVLQGQGTCGVGIKIGREGDAGVDFESGDGVFAAQPGW